MTRVDVLAVVEEYKQMTLQLSGEERLIVDLVADTLKDLQKYRPNSIISSERLRKSSVQLRKLLTDGGGGHYNRAWKLIGLQGQPTVRMSDLDAMYAKSGLNSRTIIWVEAPLTQAIPDKWELVVNSTKIIPEDLVGAQMSAVVLGTLIGYKVLDLEGALYFVGYAKETGAVVATKYEPLNVMSKPNIPLEQQYLQNGTIDLAQSISCDYSVDDLCASSAVIAGKNRVPRRHIISFVANRRGAHIDASTHDNFRDVNEAQKEALYDLARNIPSWVDERHSIEGQLFSLCLAIGSSDSTQKFLDRWRELPKKSPYTNP